MTTTVRALGEGMPPHRRTQFWVIPIWRCAVLVGPRSPATAGRHPARHYLERRHGGLGYRLPVERLTRNTDINFDRQQRRPAG